MISTALSKKHMEEKWEGWLELRVGFMSLTLGGN